MSGIFQAEAQHPGFTYDLINGILAKAEVKDRVDMAEALLRLEGSNTCTGLFDILMNSHSTLSQTLART